MLQPPEEVIADPGALDDVDVENRGRPRGDQDLDVIEVLRRHDSPDGALNVRVGDSGTHAQPAGARDLAGRDEHGSAHDEAVDPYIERVDLSR